MKKNLISVGTLADDDNTVIFSDTHCWVIKDHHIIALGHRDHSNGLYHFGSHLQANAVHSHDFAAIWHKRFGHLSYQSLHHLSSKDRVIGLPTISSKIEVCEHCLTGRQHRQPLPKQSLSRASKPGKKLHSDLMGPLLVPTLAGSRYVLVFTDDYSRYSWVYFL
jgi:hypothetical protein